MWFDSVESNMEHSELSARLCQIAKAIIITLETGYILADLYLNEPPDGVNPFESGRIKIVTETVVWLQLFALLKRGFL